MMSITDWTASQVSRTISNLSPVLKHHLNIPIQITNQPEVTEETKIILVLGSEPLKVLQDEKIIHKNRTITSLRNTPVYRNKIPILISYSPDIGDIDHGYQVHLLTDVGMAVRYWETNSFLPLLGTYRYVPDFTDVLQTIATRFEETGKPVDVFLDTETVGLDPYRLPSPDHPGAYLVTIQVTDRLTFADAVLFESRAKEEYWLSNPWFHKQIDFLLNSPMVKMKGANFKYDLNWLAVRGGFTCSNFVFDTTLIGSLLDENRSNSLSVHVKLYAVRGAGYADHYDKNIDKSRMDLVQKKDPQGFLNYACGDVDFGLEVAESQKQELLQDTRLCDFYFNILHPAARAFEVIEQGGVLVDIPAMQELKSDLEKEQLRLIKEVSKIVGGRIYARNVDMDRYGQLNLTKASFLIDFMFSPLGLNLKPKMFTPKEDKEGNKRPATSMEHLRMFSDNPKAKDFIRLLEEYSSVKTTYNTYVVGFMEHIRSDGRMHPSYFLFVGDRDEGDGGARTGRLSCHDPAWQTIPKHTKWAKRIRRCYPAPPGYVITERDYSQGELRVIACLAEEDNMIAAYKNGLDLHIKTSARFAGYTYESLSALGKTEPDKFKDIRQLGKAGNFGLVFKVSVPGFMVYARQTYGVILTMEEATKFHSGFFEDYPKIHPFHNYCIALAKKERQVRTPLGRVRHLPLIKSPNRELVAQAERQSINSPVQGTLTDMVLWVTAIEHEMGLDKVSFPFGVTHDSINNYTPEDKVDIILKQQIDIMESLPFHKVDWEPQLTFLADGSLGPNLADLESWEK